MSLSDEAGGDGLVDFSLFPGVPVAIPVGVLTSLSLDPTRRIATDLTSFFGVENCDLDVLGCCCRDGDLGVVVGAGERDIFVEGLGRLLAWSGLSCSFVARGLFSPRAPFSRSCSLSVILEADRSLPLSFLLLASNPCPLLCLGGSGFRFPENLKSASTRFLFARPYFNFTIRLGFDLVVFEEDVVVVGRGFGGADDGFSTVFDTLLLFIALSLAVAELDFAVVEVNNGGLVLTCLLLELDVEPEWGLLSSDTLGVARSLFDAAESEPVR